MRKVLFVLVILLGILSFASVTVASSAVDFDGAWENIDTATRDITRLQIDMSGTSAQGDGATVRAWGSCVPTDCDWGTVAALTYGPDVSANVVVTAQAMTAVFTTTFNQTILVIHPQPGDLLQVESFTHFTDGSTRSNYSTIETFQRAQQCIDLTKLPIGTGPNPLVVQNVSFKVSNLTGPALTHTTVHSNGTFVGLDAQRALEITFPTPHKYQSVALTLVRQAMPSKITAFNGPLMVATATMVLGQNVAETVTLSGTGNIINRILVRPPSDETLLLKLCYGSNLKAAS